MAINRDILIGSSVFRSEDLKAAVRILLIFLMDARQFVNVNWWLK